MRTTRKSSLFLMELIIAILFFSLSAAVCVRLFAASYLLGQQSTYRDVAMLQAQSMAELFRAADGEVDSVLSYANASASDNEKGEGVYQGSITQDGAVYAITLTVVQSDNAPTLTIEIVAPSASAQQESIVTLQTKVYLPLQVEQGG